jgi:hypothetical protein
VARKHSLELPDLGQLEALAHDSPDGRRLALDVVFNGPRGGPRGVLAASGAHLDERFPIDRPSPNVLRLALRWPPHGDKVRLDLGTEGDTADLVKLVARGADGQPLGVIGRTGETPEVYQPGSEDWEDVTNSLDPARHIESVERELEAFAHEEGERWRGRRFFAELDRETNPFLLLGMAALGRIHREDVDQRRLAIEAVGNELRERVRLRCRGLDEGAGTCPSLEDRRFDFLEARCRSISRIFLGLVDRYLGQNVSAFERVFTLFANGDLRMNLPSLVVTAQPSSANFFLFGEFALMACDYGIDQERWWHLANVMVRSQRIFARVYAPEDVEGADFFSYSGKDYSRRGRPYDEDELASLEVEYRGADLRLEAAKNAASSMPGLLG